MNEKEETQLKFKNDIDQLKCEIKAQKEQNNNLDALNKTMISELNNFKEKEKDFSTEISNLRKSNSDFEDRIGGYEQALDGLKKEIQEKNNNLKSLVSP